MGNYATTTSISLLMPGYLSGNTTTSDSEGTAIWDKHVTRAEGVVNGYVANRYDLSSLIIGTTTTNVPPLLRTLTEDIASWFAARGAYAQDGGKRQEYLDDYKLAMEMLKEISDGKRKLAFTDGSLMPINTGRYMSSTEEYAHIINLDPPDNWEVSQTQKDDIDGTRD